MDEGDSLGIGCLRGCFALERCALATHDLHVGFDALIFLRLESSRFDG